MAKLTKKRREELCAQELTRLQAAFVADDEVTQEKIDGLVHEAAFLRASLVELKDEIRGHGYVETYQNGANQSGKKDSSYVKAYNNLLKSYTTVCKLLNDYSPAAASLKDDGFDDL
jgi:hypothetical protein